MIDKTKTYTTPESFLNIPLCEKMLKSPHILIGGTTGAGKSVLIDDIIYYLLTHYTPKTARLWLIDIKRVTFAKYANLPHTDAFITETADAVNALKAIIEIMLKRYKSMEERGLTDYDGAHIYVFIDEIADLMTTCKKEIMPLIQRIAQLGRASKIQLICATQCPNRRIIPAELTVNFPGRVALRCLSRIESRQIIYTTGAETLPQYGKCIYLHCDGLYYSANIPFIDGETMTDLIFFWLNQGENGRRQAQKDTDDARKRAEKRTRRNWLLFRKWEYKRPQKEIDNKFLDFVEIIDDYDEN